MLHHDLFNSLPSLQTANNLFLDHKAKILSHLNNQPVFREYPDYAISLVHRHTHLETGEIMVARGAVSEPERVNPEIVYPISWLASGEAYEYSVDPSPHAKPPSALLETLNKVVGDLPRYPPEEPNPDNQVVILGIRYIGDLHVRNQSLVLVERTRDRSSFTTVMERSAIVPSLKTNEVAIGTCWLLGSYVATTIHICIGEGNGAHQVIDCVRMGIRERDVQPALLN